MTIQIGCLVLHLPSQSSIINGLTVNVFIEKDSKFAFAKATQLPSVLEAEKLCLEEEKKSVQQNKPVKSAQFVQYYQVWTLSIDVLCSIIRLEL